jgi:hypothetical protein
LLAGEKNTQHEKSEMGQTGQFSILHNATLCRILRRRATVFGANAVSGSDQRETD